MSHKAVVAYRVGKNRFNTHHSEWGGHKLELADKITEESPLGGESTGAKITQAFTQLLEDAGGEDQDAFESVTETDGTIPAVNPEPINTDVRIEDIVNNFDYLHGEAVYVVEPDFTVHGFESLSAPFGQTDREDPIPGILVEPPQSNSEEKKYDLLPMASRARGIRDVLKPLSSESGAITATHARQAADSIANNDFSLEEYLEEIRTRCNASGVAGLFTQDAAQEIFTQLLLSCSSIRPDTRVLPHSRLVEPHHFEQYPLAFVRYTGMRTILGRQVPTEYDTESVQEWMIPLQFDLPNPLEQDKEHVPALN